MPFRKTGTETGSELGVHAKGAGPDIPELEMAGGIGNGCAIAVESATDGREHHFGVWDWRVAANGLDTAGERGLERRGRLDDEHPDDQREQLHRTGIIVRLRWLRTLEILGSIHLFVLSQRREMAFDGVDRVAAGRAVPVLPRPLA